MNSHRRILLSVVPAAGATLIASRAAVAQPARADEKDATSVALGYKHDAAAVDTKKFPQFVKGSNCANCSLYAGKPTDPWATCGALGGKQVNAKGWCSAWNKRAG